VNWKQIGSLVAFVVGIVLIVFAVQSMDTFREELAKKITGKYSKETMTYFIVGIALLVGGTCGVIFYRNRK
jgi:drug/metabolite transporter (DMT)-like permease